MGDLKFETIKKTDIPEVVYDTEPIVNHMREAITALDFDQALKVECPTHAEAKHAQASAHGAVAYLRRTKKVSFSLRTQISKEELAPEEKKKYEASSRKGLFPRNHYVFIWKETANAN